MRIHIIIIALLSTNLHADHGSWRDSFISGALSGAATTIALEPVLYVKNRWQQGLSIRWHPSSIWRGLPVNAAGFVPTMALQNLSYTIVREQMHSDAPTRLQTLVACLAAGCASAIPSCPRELIILHQQNNGGSSWSIARDLATRHGKTVFWRGLAPIAVRNSSFAGFLFLVSPSFKQHIAHATDNEAISMIMPGIMAGALSALISHPADTTKTALQTNPGQSFSTIMRLMWQGKINGSSGLAAYYKGIAPRVLGVALTMMFESNFDEASNKLLDAISARFKN